MRVRFARWLAVGFVAAGSALTVLGIVLIATGNGEGGIPALVPGLLMTLIGGLYLGPLPYVVVTDSSVSVPVIAGGQGRIVIGPRDRLRMDGDRLVVVRSGEKQSVPAYRAMAHRADWDGMAATLRERRRDPR